MEQGEIRYYIELPWDEYYNRGYTARQPEVISAYYEPGTGAPGTWGGGWGRSM